MGIAGLLAAVTVAITLAVAAVAKVRSPQLSVASVEAFGVPTGAAKPVSTALPVVELILAIALLIPATRTLGGFGASALLALFTAAIVRSLAAGRAPTCHCFGSLSAKPVDQSTVVRNVALLFLAIVAALA